MKEQGKYTVSFPKIISSLYLLQGLNLLDLKNVVSMHLITIIGFIFVNLPTVLCFSQNPSIKRGTHFTKSHCHCSGDAGQIGGLA